MNSKQTPEEAFRQELRHYLSLSNIKISTDLSKEEKQQYYAFSPFNRLLDIQATQQKSAQDHVENIAKHYNIFNPLQAIVRCVNSFAKTNKKSAVKIFNEELNRILAPSWVDLTKLPNNKVQGSSVDMMRAGLKQAEKDKSEGKQPDFTMRKGALLCHLLMAYAGSPSATFMIYTALPYYTIVD